MGKNRQDKRSQESNRIITKEYFFRKYTEAINEIRCKGFIPRKGREVKSRMGGTGNAGACSKLEKDLKNKSH